MEGSRVSLAGSRVREVCTGRDLITCTRGQGAGAEVWRCRIEEV